MNIRSDFHGPNLGYILELYDRYLEDPNSVDSATVAYFANFKPAREEDEAAKMASPANLSNINLNKIAGVANLAESIRKFGNLAAHIDPLGTPPPGDYSIDMKTYGLTEDDLRALPASLVAGPVAVRAANALEAIEALRRIHSSSIGYDFEHINIREERDWLMDASEAGAYRHPKDPINLRGLLERLTQVEMFERFLHKMFPGKFRFSIEGVDMLVPMLDELIGDSAESGIVNVLVGMAHRGRLNVMTHVLNKPYAKMIAKFKDPVSVFKDDIGWTGDVKYHESARRSVRNGRQIDLVVTLAPNPSHLEAVNPVIQGMARAAGTKVNKAGAPDFDYRITLPLIVHGDAAFQGQGIVAETLNLSRLRGYTTGGTIHIITNNQLGYTTNPESSRSTLYASDLAKGFDIPIIHVNADDPEACIEAVRMAFGYFAKFRKDFLIDLVGYRRHGHNEADEPSFTQPLMYQVIDKHPTAREIWANKLIARGEITRDFAEELISKSTKELHAAFESPEAAIAAEEGIPIPPPTGLAKKTKTAVPAESLRAINKSLTTLPEGFTIHPKLVRGFERKKKALDNPDEASIDWSQGEELAFASILADGISIRLTGQDSERGTYSQRHCVLSDAKNGRRFAPLQSFAEASAAFEVHNSPLTENATIGFEYGYNIQEPGRLVLWEAQYGDFINGAHTIIDEFVTSARAKWGQTPSLALMLPHAYEGQGPDHCSGRLERFLELCAEINMRVANCTTSAQYFHLLRRQALLLKTDPLPLIIMTPKGLLRHPLVASPLRAFSEGKWVPVINDDKARERADKVRRLILCSGKVYVDLVSSELRDKSPDIAIARVEQLYSLPADEITQIIKGYPKLKEVVWLQEEPENMGAWAYMYPRLRKIIAGDYPLHYIGRSRNSSPAEGFASMHKVNQDAIVQLAYNMKLEIKQKGVLNLKNV
ncbi:MAG: 2-oxoglutarate dehydrogenase E1 component [Deltaproteobacteria bacterium]